MLPELFRPIEEDQQQMIRSGTAPFLSLFTEQLLVICREPHYNDPHWETGTAMQSELLNGLKTAGCPEDTLTIRILDFREGKKLHDRSLRATIITADGSSKTLIYDLSGGIDHLMDVARETKVYAYVREE